MMLKRQWLLRIVAWMRATLFLYVPLGQTTFYLVPNLGEATNLIFRVDQCVNDSLIVSY